ncbi:MAG: ATP-dependent zinc metalloprotease FtsH, partial [Chloroflexota bacterium]
GAKQARLMSDEEKRLVAYHESGHALVAKLTPGADPIAKVTIIPHGMALGATQQLPEDDRHDYPKSYLVGRLAAMMGGRAAENLVFDEPSTGAENDLKQATQLARRMIGVWAMDKDLGPVWYGEGEENPFLGREMAQPRDYAEATAAELDAAVKDLLVQAYGRAYDLLSAHRQTLDVLAQELIANETVDAQRLDDLLKRAA